MKILVLQTGFIGDVILSSALWVELKKIYPQASLYLICTPQAEDVVKHNPAIAKVIVYDKRGKHSGWNGFKQLLALLKAEQFDIAFGLHKSWRSSLLLYLAKIPLRFGFREASGWYLYTRVTRRNLFFHEVQRNLAILGNVNVDIAHLAPKLSISVSEEATQVAGKLLAKTNELQLIGIAPGSVWATKRWRVEGFAEVADELSKMGYVVVLLGGPADADIAKRIESIANSELINLVGQTSMEVSIAVISKLKLLISNDSAPMHIASATGVPVVAIFCATIPEFGFGPWGVPHRCVGVEYLSCRPCGRHGRQFCPTGTNACQNLLTKELVLEAAGTLLNRINPVGKELGVVGG